MIWKGENGLMASIQTIKTKYPIQDKKNTIVGYELITRIEWGK